MNVEVSRLIGRGLAGLFCWLLVELADLGLAVAGYFEEAPGEVDGFFFGFGLDESEAAYDLPGLGEGAVGDGVVAVDRTDAGCRVRMAGSLRCRAGSLLQKPAR